MVLCSHHGLALAGSRATKCVPLQGTLLVGRGMMRAVVCHHGMLALQMWVDKNQAEGTRTFDFVADELNACLPEDIRVRLVCCRSSSA